MRYETDSFGQLPIPDDAYYGINTERGRQNFDVSGVTVGDFPQYVTCLAMVKKATALANADIGSLSQPISKAICTAADEVMAGKIGPEQFPLDIIQGGGCTSTNMNINEVIANRANEILTGNKGYDFVHPNNHVNMGQSTNDSIPTTLHITMYFYIKKLINSLKHIEQALQEKVELFKDVVKTSRTCLQDAVPITLGQEFSGYLPPIQRGIKRLEALAEECLDVPLGATAVGTGLGARKGYTDAVYKRLTEVVGVPVTKTDNFFDGLQNGDVYVQISATLKTIAVSLSKFATDLRMMSSGDRAGMHEIFLPATQAGSSIMPAKINPVMPELINQVAYQVCGNDVVVTMAVEGGELDLNVWEAIISKSLFESANLLTNSIILFTDKCVVGIKANVEKCRLDAENTLSSAVVLSTIFGYQTGVKVAKYAHKEGLSIKQAALQLGVMDKKLADELLNPMMLTDVVQSVEITNRLAEEQKNHVKDLIAQINHDARQAIFTGMLQMTWADGILAEEEKLVMEIVAEALQLGLTKDQVDEILNQGSQPLTNVEQLNHRDRELVYLCAAWLSAVDDDIDESEVALLERMSSQLHISPKRAEILRQRVTDIRTEKHEYVPLWEASPWWEEFEELLVRAIGLVRVGTVPLSSRKQIFDIMYRMVMADGVLAVEEQIAMQLTANVLQLGLSKADVKQFLAQTPPALDDVEAMSMKDRELGYLSAAWLSTVDNEVHELELALLKDIQAELELEDTTAKALFDQAMSIWSERGELAALSDDFPWWEQIEQLLVRFQSR